MKLASIALPACLLLAACKGETPPAGPEPTPSVTADDIKQTAADAGADLAKLGQQVGEKIKQEAQDAGDALRTQRDIFSKIVSGQKTAMEENIAQARKDAEALPPEKQAEVKPAMEKLDEAGKRLAEKLDRLDEVTADKWEEFKQDTQKAMTELNEAFQNAHSKIRN